MWRNMSCEELLPLFGINTARYEVWEVDPTNPTNNLIRLDSQWGVHVQWRNNGSIVPFLNPSIRWRITCFLEQYGPGEGPALAPQLVAFNIVVPPPPNNFVQYDTNLTFPAGLVPQGTYKFAIRLRLIGPPPLLLPMPLGCMAEEPMLDFFPGW